MVELRWLIRMVDRPRGIDDGFHQPPLPDKLEVSVLQYRCGNYDSRDRRTGEDIWEGSDWRDVPTVRDDSASSEQEGK